MTHPPGAGTGATPPHRDPTGSATGIIRRAPTGAIPVAAPPTGMTGRTPVPPPAVDFGPNTEPSAVVPISACALAIISGWATSVVATDLVASWWHSDRMFCVAVGFLTLVFAATTVTGVIALLRRRWPGGQLIAIGALVALLTFGSLFLAGARVPWIVHAIPVIQVASAVLSLHPATRRWVRRA